jgi:hypothetical protein
MGLVEDSTNGANQCLDQMEFSFFNVWPGPGRGGPIDACRSDRNLTIAVASDPAMGEEIIRRLNNSDRSDQEDQWAL